VLVRQVARSVQMQGYGTDVVTLRDNAHDRPQFSLGPIGQVVRLDVDDMPVHDPDWLNVVDEISQNYSITFVVKGESIKLFIPIIGHRVWLRLEWLKSWVCRGFTLPISWPNGSFVKVRKFLPCVTPRNAKY